VLVLAAKQPGKNGDVEKTAKTGATAFRRRWQPGPSVLRILKPHAARGYTTRPPPQPHWQVPGSGSGAVSGFVAVWLTDSVASSSRRCLVCLPLLLQCRARRSSLALQRNHLGVKGDVTVEAGKSRCLRPCRYRLIRVPSILVA